MGGPLHERLDEGTLRVNQIGRPEVWALVIVGQFGEPFLESALRSVDWVDGYAVVNTDPEGMHGQENERIVRRTVPREKLKLERLWMNPFDFAKARNKALRMIDFGAYALILDADDVHYPSLQGYVKDAIDGGHTVAGGHFWHHCVYKDLWHSKPYRTILFSTGPGIRFENTQGTVHEELVHPDKDNPFLMDYTYAHYGYIKPAREVSRRWESYRKLGAPIHDYDRDQPDKALDDWPRICQVYPGEHPPAVAEVLKRYPSAPASAIGKIAGPPRVGLVMLTWNDAENLRTCLKTLNRTREPFELCVVDNGSTDGSDVLPLTAFEDIPKDAESEHNTTVFTRPIDQSLTQALNIGFGHFLDREDLDYIGWIHPDHSFEWPDWLTQLREAMDEHPEWAKLGCQEAEECGHGLRAGNSQCFIVRRTALKEVGLFNERFLACGGYEDWEMNYRLLKVGKVMIWPDAIVRHKSMSTRQRHDNNQAALANSETYTRLTGLGEAPV